MNVRVFLLVLVTGLFMAAWNGDQAAMQAVLASREQARTDALASRESVADTQAPMMRLASTRNPADSDNSPEVQTAALAATRPSPEFPLPAGISAGSYQAVSDLGAIRRVVVRADEATGQVVRDLFITDATDGSRWYLIRQH